MAFDFTDPESLAERAPIYALAFDEAGQALAIQRQVLADVRSRAAGVIAIAALVTSILGVDPASPGQGDLATFVAVASLLGVGLSAFGLFWLGHLESSNDPEALISDYAEPRAIPLALVQRDLAIHRAASVSRNRQTLERMSMLLRLAVVSLAAEVITWVVTSTSTL